MSTNRENVFTGLGTNTIYILSLFIYFPEGVRTYWDKIWYLDFFSDVRYLIQIKTNIAISGNPNRVCLLCYYFNIVHTIPWHSQNIINKILLCGRHRVFRPWTPSEEFLAINQFSNKRSDNLIRVAWTRWVHMAQDQSAWRFSSGNLSADMIMMMTVLWSPTNLCLSPLLTRLAIYLHFLLPCFLQ